MYVPDDFVNLLIEFSGPFFVLVLFVAAEQGEGGDAVRVLQGRVGASLQQKLNYV